jgi:sulfane dehydrogenase subunit SoxC
MSNSKKEKASRRTFLQRAAVGATGLISGTALAQDKVASETQVLSTDPFKSMKVAGAPIGTNLYGLPSAYERATVRHVRPTDKQYLSSSSRTPLQELDGIITPNGLFYERHHNGVPNIDPTEHKLMLHGLVERPLLFTLDDLRRFPSESKIYFLECSGNPDYKLFGKTAAEANGLVSCAEWTGVKLKTVLQEAGVKSSAKWIIAEGADGAGLNRSIPIEKCMDDALLVYSQNGERLRPEQGYPLRIFLPGFEGNMSVK